MTKKDLVDQVAEMSELTKVEANKAVAAIIQAIEDSLVNGDSVKLLGFGTFSVTKRAAREGMNPSNGKKIKIPAKKIAKFKPGSKLLGSLN